MTRGFSRGLTILVAALLAVAGCTSPNDNETPSTKEVSQIGDPLFNGSPERWSYQQALRFSPDRFEPVYDVVEYDSSLWVREGASTGYCQKHCGTAVLKNGAYEVSLPVGYQHDKNVSPMPKDLVPISQLNYWNPETHQKTTASKGQLDSVQLPFELDRRLGSFNLNRGETGYVSVRQVGKTPDGRYFLNHQAEIRSEPLGPDFSAEADALIVRRTDGKGYEILLPKDYRPVVGNVDTWIPVKVSHAESNLLVPSYDPSEVFAV